MKHLAAPLVLASCIALMTIPAFTQAEEETASSASATVANVYVQTHQGVNVYDVASNGKLTLVKGSPFATSGQMEGVNGKYLISVGTTNLHTYPISSNGAIGKQIADVNTQDYGGSECGATSTNGDPNGAVLDHSGKYFYIQMYDGYGGSCSAWQTYEVTSSGQLEFLNDVEYESYSYGNPNAGSVPTISSNDNFGYGVFIGDGKYSTPTFSSFAKASSGVLDINEKFDVTYPEANPAGTPDGPWVYYPDPIYRDPSWIPSTLEAADPNGHLAVLLGAVSGLCPQSSCGSGMYGPLQFASFTINEATGAISSTNTWENMPTPELKNINGMDMSISGKLLALSGAPGLQIFHFNGAAPITTDGGVLLPSVDVDQLGWDNNNHLYALSYSSDKMYVYSATPTSIKEVAGSPFALKNAYGITGLIIVPK